MEKYSEQNDGTASRSAGLGNAHCVECGSEFGITLRNMQMRSAICPKCGKVLSPGEDTPSLAEAIERFVETAGHHTATDPDFALALLREVLDVEPWNARALHLVGIILDERGATEKAFRHLKQAIAFDPGKSKYHYELGVAYMGQKQFMMARDEFEHALAIYPDYTYAVQNLAHLYTMTFDWVAAAIAIEHLKVMDNNGPRSRHAEQNFTMMHSLVANAPGWFGNLWRAVLGRQRPPTKKDLREQLYLVEILHEAFDLQQQNRLEEGAAAFRGLLDCLPGDSAGYFLVSEYLSECLMLLDRFAESLSLTLMANENLPCARALVQHARILLIEAGSDKVHNAFYKRVIKDIFGVDCGFVVRTRDVHDGQIGPPVVEVSTLDGEMFTVRRTGNVIEITAPDGTQVVHQVYEDSYVSGYDA